MFRATSTWLSFVAILAVTAFSIFLWFDAVEDEAATDRGAAMAQLASQAVAAGIWLAVVSAAALVLFRNWRRERELADGRPIWEDINRIGG